MVRALQSEIEAAVEALRAGELVAFPTETVYGLGANAADANAVAKVFTAKGRPSDHPLIVHLDSAKYIHRWVRDFPAAAKALAAKFWPGPLTLVLPKEEKVLDVVTGGQDSVAIRVPSHRVAQQLLTAFGGGLVAPSANRYGRLSPTRPEHVREELGEAVSVILDGGECKLGVESTIVSCLVEGQVRLLRPGAVTLNQLRAVVGEVAVGADEGTPRTPGSVVSHYAPSTPLEIVPADQLEARVEELSAGGARLAVLAMRLPMTTLERVSWINAGRKPQTYAHDLYANLRTLDKAAGCVRILVQEVPATEAWDAVRDRLMKAAAKSPDR